MAEVGKAGEPKKGLEQLFAPSKPEPAAKKEKAAVEKSAVDAKDNSSRAQAPTAVANPRINLKDVKLTAAQRREHHSAGGDIIEAQIGDVRISAYDLDKAMYSLQGTKQLLVALDAYAQRWGVEEIEGEAPGDYVLRILQAAQERGEFELANDAVSKVLAGRYYQSLGEVLEAAIVKKEAMERGIYLRPGGARGDLPFSPDLDPRDPIAYSRLLKKKQISVEIVPADPALYNAWLKAELIEKVGGEEQWLELQAENIFAAVIESYDFGDVLKDVHGPDRTAVVQALLEAEGADFRDPADGAFRFDFAEATLRKLARDLREKKGPAYDLAQIISYNQGAAPQTIAELVSCALLDAPKEVRVAARKLLLNIDLVGQSQAPIALSIKDGVLVLHKDKAADTIALSDLREGRLQLDPQVKDGDFSVLHFLPSSAAKSTKEQQEALGTALTQVFELIAADVEFSFAQGKAESLVALLKKYGLEKLAQNPRFFDRLSSNPNVEQAIGRALIGQLLGGTAPAEVQKRLSQLGLPRDIEAMFAADLPQIALLAELLPDPALAHELIEGKVFALDLNHVEKNQDLPKALVAFLQRQLWSMGFLKKEKFVEGVFAAPTAKALKAYFDDDLDRLGLEQIRVLAAGAMQEGEHSFVGDWVLNFPALVEVQRQGGEVDPIRFVKSYLRELGHTTIDPGTAEITPRCLQLLRAAHGLGVNEEIKNRVLAKLKNAPAWDESTWRAQFAQRTLSLPAGTKIIVLPTEPEVGENYIAQLLSHAKLSKYESTVHVDEAHTMLLDEEIAAYRIIVASKLGRPLPIVNGRIEARLRADDVAGLEFLYQEGELSDEDKKAIYYTAGRLAGWPADPQKPDGKALEIIDLTKEKSAADDPNFQLINHTLMLLRRRLLPVLKRYKVASGKADLAVAKMQNDLAPIESFARPLLQARRVLATANDVQLTDDEKEQIDLADLNNLEVSLKKSGSGVKLEDKNEASKITPEDFAALGRVKNLIDPKQIAGAKNPLAAEALTLTSFVPNLPLTLSPRQKKDLLRVVELLRLAANYEQKKHFEQSLGGMWGYVKTTAVKAYESAKLPIFMDATVANNVNECWIALLKVDLAKAAGISLSDANNRLGWKIDARNLDPDFLELFAGQMGEHLQRSVIETVLQGHLGELPPGMTAVDFIRQVAKKRRQSKKDFGDWKTVDLQANDPPEVQLVKLLIQAAAFSKYGSQGWFAGLLGARESRQLQSFVESTTGMGGFDYCSALKGRLLLNKFISPEQLENLEAEALSPELLLATAKAAMETAVLIENDAEQRKKVLHWAEVFAAAARANKGTGPGGTDKILTLNASANNEVASCLRALIATKIVTIPSSGALENIDLQKILAGYGDTLKVLHYSEPTSSTSHTAALGRYHRLLAEDSSFANVGAAYGGAPTQPSQTQKRREAWWQKADLEWSHVPAHFFASAGLFGHAVTGHKGLMHPMYKWGQWVSWAPKLARGLWHLHVARTEEETTRAKHFLSTIPQEPLNSWMGVFSWMTGIAPFMHIVESIKEGDLDRTVGQFPVFAPMVVAGVRTNIALASRGLRWAGRGVQRLRGAPPRASRTARTQAHVSAGAIPTRLESSRLSRALGHGRSIFGTIGDAVWSPDGYLNPVDHVRAALSKKAAAVNFPRIEDLSLSPSAQKREWRLLGEHGIETVRLSDKQVLDLLESYYVRRGRGFREICADIPASDLAIKNLLEAYKDGYLPSMRKRLQRHLRYAKGASFIERHTYRLQTQSLLHLDPKAVAEVLAKNSTVRVDLQKKIRKITGKDLATAQALIEQEIVRRGFLTRADTRPLLEKAGLADKGLLRNAILDGSILNFAGLAGVIIADGLFHQLGWDDHVVLAAVTGMTAGAAAGALVQTGLQRALAPKAYKEAVKIAEAGVKGSKALKLAKSAATGAVGAVKGLSKGLISGALAEHLFVAGTQALNLDPNGNFVRVGRITSFVAGGAVAAKVGEKLAERALVAGLLSLKVGGRSLGAAGSAVLGFAGRFLILKDLLNFTYDSEGSDDSKYEAWQKASAAQLRIAMAKEGMALSGVNGVESALVYGIDSAAQFAFEPVLRNRLEPSALELMWQEAGKFAFAYGAATDDLLAKVVLKEGQKIPLPEPKVDKSPGFSVLADASAATVDADALQSQLAYYEKVDANDLNVAAALKDMAAIARAKGGSKKIEQENELNLLALCEGLHLLAGRGGHAQLHKLTSLLGANGEVLDAKKLAHYVLSIELTLPGEDGEIKHMSVAQVIVLARRQQRLRELMPVVKELDEVEMRIKPLLPADRARAKELKAKFSVADEWAGLVDEARTANREIAALTTQCSDLEKQRLSRCEVYARALSLAYEVATIDVLPSPEREQMLADRAQKEAALAQLPANVSKEKYLHYGKLLRHVHLLRSLGLKADTHAEKIPTLLAGNTQGLAAFKELQKEFGREVPLDDGVFAARVFAAVDPSLKDDRVDRLKTSIATLIVEPPTKVPGIQTAAAETVDRKEVDKLARDLQLMLVRNDSAFAIATLLENAKPAEALAVAQKLDKDPAFIKRFKSLRLAFLQRAFEDAQGNWMGIRLLRALSDAEMPPSPALLTDRINRLIENKDDQQIRILLGARELKAATPEQKCALIEVLLEHNRSGFSAKILGDKGNDVAILGIINSCTAPEKKQLVELLKQRGQYDELLRKVEGEAKAQLGKALQI